MRLLMARMWTLLALAAVAAAAGPGLPANHELLAKLGLTKRRLGPSLLRKRLAHEPRASSEDSHIFIVKLPPSQHYYDAPHRMHPNDINKVPVNFMSNGKPARVYHWNLPELTKLSRGRSEAKTLPVRHKPRKPAFSYYAPARPKPPALHKYFPGNGKPHSFYVLQKHSKKPQYHRLLP